jgi:hypothetical protein
MADHGFDGFEEDFRASGRGGHFLHIAGGLTSMALVIGGLVWGYKLAVRNVEGIPIVRAMEGAMRVAPETPGGEVAENMGLAVNDVAAVGAATPLPESLTLAPREVELTAEDIAGLGAFEAEDASLLTASAALTDPAVLAAPAEDTTAAAVAAALTEALTPEEQLAADGADLLDAGAPMRSLFPRRRPGATDAAPVTEVQEVAAVTAPLVDVASLAVGTPLVQLGTFNTEEDARAEWARIAGRFGDLMQAKSIVLEPARSGGSTFIRLRAYGFAGEDDARRFCTALLSENTSCVPTAYR